MVQYRDLNAPPPRMLADVVADMKASERQSKTGDAGVKDLGETGDVVWPRPDGTPVSVRDVDLDLADARQRIEDAEGDLAGAQARIDTALDAEGHIREDEILRNATLIGDTVVDNINVVGKLVGTDGVFTGTVDFENINVTDEVLAARISGEHIYGTVIEGGLFKTSDSLPGRVELSDTAFLPSGVPGSNPQLPGIRITPPDTSGVAIPPSLGGFQDGLRIEGGTATTGERSYIEAAPKRLTLQTTASQSAILGQIAFAPTELSIRHNRDNGGFGSRIRMRNNSAFIQSYDTVNNFPVSEIEAGSGGAALTSGNSEIRAAKSYGYMQATEGSKRSYIYSGLDRVEVSRRDANLVETGAVVLNDTSLRISSRVGGVARSLEIDAGGVWAKQGSDSVSLVPEVRAFQYSATWNADLSPAPIMVQHLPGGKLCQAQIRVQNLSGSSLPLPYDTWVDVNYNPIPGDLRGGFTDYIEVTLPQLNARGRVEMNYSTGRFRVKNLNPDYTINWNNNGSIWFPLRWFSPN